MPMNLSDRLNAHFSTTTTNADDRFSKFTIMAIYTDTLIRKARKIEDGNNNAYCRDYVAKLVHSENGATVT